MKMMYGGVPVNSLKVKHYEMNTNSATVQPYDLQTGITCFARGEKITGTGKSFEFASYGDIMTNAPNYIPTIINVVEISSLDYPIKSLVKLNNMRDMDFSAEQAVAIAVINGVEYPIAVKCENNFMTLSCEKTISLEIFYGKDRYV